MTNNADSRVVSIAQARAERAAAKARKRMVGTCARGVKEECGMRDANECRVHGPYQRDPDAS